MDEAKLTQLLEAWKAAATEAALLRSRRDYIWGRAYLDSKGPTQGVREAEAKVKTAEAAYKAEAARIEAQAREYELVFASTPDPK